MSFRLDEVEREIVKSFLLNGNVPSYKNEIIEDTGINKKKVKVALDKSTIFKKIPRIRKGLGYLDHYLIKSDFKTFFLIARDFMFSNDSRTFMRSEYAKRTFERYGYIRLFEKLGIKREGYFDFKDGLDRLRILTDYSTLKKRLFTYVIFHPDNARNISSSLSDLEKPPLKIRPVLEEMRGEDILLKTGEIYLINPEFVKKVIKEQPLLFPFLRKMEADRLSGLVKEKLNENLCHEQEGHER